MSLDFTELQTIDFAFGAFISGAFDDLAPNGPDNYARFISRPIADKIFRTEHDDPKGLLDKLTADKKGAAPSKRPDLPVVAYYRKPGLTNGENVAVLGWRQRYDPDLLEAYRLSLLPVDLDYAMTFVAWDKPTLDKLCLAWYAYIAIPKKVRFVVPVKIAGMIIPDIAATILDPKNVVFTDASMPPGEQRLYAVTASHTVRTQITVGEAIEPITEIEVHGITRQYIRVGMYA